MFTKALHRIALTVVMAGATLVGSAGAQSFELEELPTEIGNPDSHISTAPFINAQGHVAGNRSVPLPATNATIGHAYLWDGNHVIDIATGQGSSDARALNDLDQVVGTDSGIVGRGYFWSRQGMIPLGTLGGDFSFPADVNNLSQVVGASTTEPGSGLPRPFLWTVEGGMQDLGGLAPGSDGRASRVNELGQVAGTSRAEDSSIHGFFWSEATGMVDIGPASFIGDMNVLGQIVGRTADGLPFRVTVSVSPEGEATVDREILPTPPDIFGEPSSGIAFEVNDAGQAVGVSSSRVVFWDADGTLTVNEDLLWGGSSGPAINDSSHVAFIGSVFTPAVTGAFFWSPQDGTTVQLPTLEDRRTEARAINGFDEIAGSSGRVGGARAVVWHPTGPLPPGSPEILALIEFIDHLLAAGRIFDGDARSLQSKLHAADAQLRRGVLPAALGILTATELQIEQLIFNGFIHPDVGDELLGMIDEIVLLL